MKAGTKKMMAGFDRMHSQFGIYQKHKKEQWVRRHAIAGSIKESRRAMGRKAHAKSVKAGYSWFK